MFIVMIYFKPKPVSGSFVVDLFVHFLDVQVSDPHLFLQTRDLAFDEPIGIFQPKSVVGCVEGSVESGVFGDALERLVGLNASAFLLASMHALAVHQLSLHIVPILNDFLEVLLSRPKGTSIFVKTI
jgi:hypothetical protein